MENIWFQEGEAERRFVLGGLFGYKREEVRGAQC